MSEDTPTRSTGEWLDLMATVAGLLIFGGCGWAAASAVAGLLPLDGAPAASAVSVAELSTGL